MATIMTHGIAAGILTKIFLSTQRTWRFWFYLAVASMLPDIDVIGFKFGIHYGDLWGHRGFTHSFLFAFLISVCIALLTKFALKQETANALKNFFYFFIATSSHGVLDAMTDGGLGVAFFSPFDTKRYFFSWTPIRVSPIGVHGFLSQEGLDILTSEVLWIIVPLLIILGFRKALLMIKY